MEPMNRTDMINRLVATGKGDRLMYEGFSDAELRWTLEHPAPAQPRTDGGALVPGTRFDGYDDKAAELVRLKAKIAILERQRAGMSSPSRAPRSETYLDAAGGDAELAEQMKRFDVSGDFLETYQRAEPWKNGEAAALEAAHAHQARVLAGYHGDADGSAAMAPGGMGRPATAGNAAWAASNRESTIRKLSGFIDIDVLNAMSDDNLAAIEADLQEKAAHIAAASGRTGGFGSVAGDD